MDGRARARNVPGSGETTDAIPGDCVALPGVSPPSGCVTTARRPPSCNRNKSLASAPAYKQRRDEASFSNVLALGVKGDVVRSHGGVCIGGSSLGVSPLSYCMPVVAAARSIAMMRASVDDDLISPSRDNASAAAAAAPAFAALTAVTVFAAVRRDMAR